MGTSAHPLAKKVESVRARADELSRFSAPQKVTRVLQAYLEIADQALAYERTWVGSDGRTRTEPLPHFEVARKCWDSIGRVLRVMGPDVVVEVGAGTRPMATLAAAAVRRREDRMLLYEALRAGGHAAEAAAELGLVVVTTTEGESV